MVSCKPPPYGRVRDLCTALGYGSNEKEDPRYWDKFRSKMVVHRQEFMKASPGASRFPLYYDDRLVQECVNTLLNTNSIPFDGDLHWVAEQLAKLMCVQEYYSRKNNGGQARAEATRNKSKMQEYMSDRETSSDIDASYQEDCGDDDIYDGPRSPPPSGNLILLSPRYRERSMSEEEKAYIAQQAKRHLDLAYPLDGLVEGESGEWIFQAKERCPTKNLPYLFRYMHENDLYSANTSNAGAIEKFKDDVMKQLHINQGGIRVYERCKQFVSWCCKTLLKWGLLEKNGGIVRRTAKFDEALRLQRDQWISEVYTPALEKLKDNVPYVQSEAIACVKRTHQENPSGTPEVQIEDDVKDSSFPAEKIFACGPPSKKPRFSSYDVGGFGAPKVITSIDLTVDDVPNLKFEAEDDLNDCIGVSPGSGSGYQAPFASIEFETKLFLEPLTTDTVASTAIHSSPYKIIHDGLKLAHEDSPRLGPSTAMSPRRNDETAGVITPSAHIFSNADDQQDVRQINTQLPSPLPQSRTVTSPLTHTLEQFNNLNTNPLHQSRAFMSASQPDANSRLSFRFEERRGTMDMNNDNLVSRKNLLKLSLGQVFDMVCERTSQTPQMINLLNIRFQWGGRELITLRRDDSEQQWGSAKEQIRMLFTDAKGDNPSQPKFEFWVKGRREGCRGSSESNSNRVLVEDDIWSDTDA